MSSATFSYGLSRTTFHDIPGSGISLSPVLLKCTFIGRRACHCSRTDTYNSGDSMDFAELLSDAWCYTKECTLSNTTRWMQLIVTVLCLGIPFNGYIVRVYRGTTPAPEVDNWGTLFVDGLKMLAIGFVYVLPLILVLVMIFGILVLVSPDGNVEESGFVGGFFESLFTLLFYFAEFVIAAFLPVAYIRFARTGVFFEAFNFSAMKETIGKIGWINYIVAVVFIALLIGIPLSIVMFGLIFVFVAVAIIFSSELIVIFGLLAVMALLILIVMPVIGIFQARYMTRIYGMSGD